MYGMGLSLQLQDFQRVLRRRYPIAMGAISMMFVVPSVGVLLAAWFAPTPILAVGIVLLATCPGGMLSNLMTDLAGGDLALSVSMTIAVSIVYVCLIPFVASGVIDYFLIDTYDIDLPLLPTLIRIMSVTLLPVILGMITRSKFQIFAEKVRPSIKKLATLFLCIAFIFIVVDQFDVIYDNFNHLILIVIALNVIAICIAYSITRIGKLSKEESIAICVEHSIRQEGTAIFIAVTLLGSYEMSIPMVLNTPVGMVVCVLFILLFKGKGLSWHRAKSS